VTAAAPQIQKNVTATIAVCVDLEAAACVNGV